MNGIPLVIAEYKSYLTSGKDWTEAVRQLHRYQRQAPLMLAPNVFCIAADEEEFRYGTVLFHDASQRRHRATSRYLGTVAVPVPEHKGWWNEPDADQPGRPTGNPGQRPAAPQALPCAGFPATLRRVRDQEGQNDQEDRPLPAVRGGERHGRSHPGADRPAGHRPGPHRPDLAHPRLRQIPDDDLRRLQAAAARRAEQPDGA